jgi:hypothetical protein
MTQISTSPGGPRTQSLANGQRCARIGTDEARRDRVVLRLGLIALALPNTVVGGWLLFAPRSFYDGFPGFGVHWVARLGAYSEHASTDFGGALLAIALLTWLASLWLERRLVQAALMTVLLEALSHFVYHLTRLSALSAANDVANQLSLSYGVVLSSVLLVLTWRMN